MQLPTLGRVVIYRSRTGNYSAPALVTATIDTLAPVGLELFEFSEGKAGVPPLSSPTHVHLAVFTPGLPGLRAGAQDFVTEDSPGGRSENVNGVYQEWDVPLSAIDPALDPEQPAGTWHWPVRTPPRPADPR